MHDFTQRAERILSEEPSLRFLSPFLAAFPTAGVYLVGGAVRDLMLNRPTYDFDFVIGGVPRAPLEEWFSTRGRLDLTGRVFGVYKFLPNYQLPTTNDKLLPVDIALPRTEQASTGSLGGYREFDLQSDPALPIEADLARRDFTVNAMAFDVRSRILIDPYGGERDLQGRILRAAGVPRDRFTEDMSRLLRGIRFVAQLGFEFDADTWEALCAVMPETNRTRTRADGGSEFVLPRETVGRELAKALSASPSRAAQMLQASGAFDQFLPDVARAARTSSSPFFAPLENKPALPITLAILLRDATPESAKRALDAAGLSSLPRESALRAVAEDIAWIVRQLQNLPAAEALVALPPHQFERQYMNDRGRLLLETLNALGRTENANTLRARVDAIYDACDFPLNQRGETIPPLLSGADILAFGVTPGPRVRTLLDATRDAQLTGKIKTREQALAHVNNVV